MLGLYRSVADVNKLDVIHFGLGQQISVDKCVDEILRRLGYGNFYCCDGFLIENPHEPFSPPQEEAWQRKLTREFFKDLENYTSESPLVIFFDQYEKADPIFKKWLSQIFLPRVSASHPIIVVIAGREFIEPPPSLKGFRHFCLTGVNVDWYRRYVEDCKVELDSERINLIYDLLKGRPKEFVDYVKTIQSQGNVR